LQHTQTHCNTLQHTATHPKVGPGVVKIIFEFGIIELVDSILLFVARPKLHNSLEDKKKKIHIFEFGVIELVDGHLPVRGTTQTPQFPEGTKSVQSKHCVHINVHTSLKNV